MLIRDGVPTVVKDNLTDVRNIAPGADPTVLSDSFDLPYTVGKDDKLAIWLPDRSDGLQSNAAYSIRLANTEITWEDGYNVVKVF